MPENQNQIGSFIPTNNIWDTASIYSMNIPQPIKELFVILYQNINNISVNVNLKDTGYYNTMEFVNGQLFFPNPANSGSDSTASIFRQVSRKVINFGSLPNSMSKSVAHGITIADSFTFTRIYGVSNDVSSTPHSFVPLPYSSASGDNIELSVDDTNVTITTNSASWTTYTITYIVLEWITS